MTFNTNKNTNHKSRKKLGVVIVEDHHHVLEHIHYILRKKQKSMSRWKLIHLDSHPDMSCPSGEIIAKDCFFPNPKLYEQLDLSSTGIAEWIMPLCLACELQHIHWIHPPWSLHQFDLDDETRHSARKPFSFQVGAWSVNNKPCTNDATAKIESCIDLDEDMVVKVDCQHAYYMQDNSYVPTEELHLSKSITFSSSSSTITAHSLIDTLKDDDEPWVLDICLDYYICDNPFYTYLCQTLSYTPYTKSLQNLIVQFHLLHNKSVHFSKTKQEHFQNILVHFFCALKQQNDYSIIKMEDAATTTLSAFYHSSSDKTTASISDIGGTLIDSFLQSIRDYRDHVNNERENIQTKMKILAEESIQAIPYLYLPHSSNFSTFSTDKDRLAYAKQQIQNTRISLEQYHHRHRKSAKLQRKAPMLITIARSSEFTPFVDELQNMLLSELHSIYCTTTCPCRLNAMKINQVDYKSRKDDECNMFIVHDYGETEGSTLQDLFRNKYGNVE